MMRAALILRSRQAMSSIALGIAIAACASGSADRQSPTQARSRAPQHEGRSSSSDRQPSAPATSTALEDEGRRSICGRLCPIPGLGTSVVVPDAECCTFFQDAKRQVAGEWDPAGVWRQDEATGHDYGSKGRLTILQITLSPDGKPLAAVVVETSGLDFLDEEAVRASQAVMFPPPPEVLRGTEGLVSFKLGFYFTPGSKTGWKIFSAL
jgi:TonB family protein